MRLELQQNELGLLSLPLWIDCLGRWRTFNDNNRVIIDEQGFRQRSGRLLVLSKGGRRSG